MCFYAARRWRSTNARCRNAHAEESPRSLHWTVVSGQVVVSPVANRIALLPEYPLRVVIP